MAKVSVVLAVLNEEALLYDKLQALLEQSLECQILPVDRGSVDGSREILADCARQFPEDICPIYVDGDIGKAFNAGLEQAAGEYVAFLTCGDALDPDMYLALYEAAKGAAICGCDYTENDLFRCAGAGALETQDQKAAYIAQPGCVACRIYRREFLLEKGIRFPNEGGFAELVFDFLTALHGDKSEKAAGCYLKHDQRLPQRNDKRWYQRLDAAEQLADMAGDVLPELVEHKYMALQMGNIRNVCLGQFSKPDSAQLERIRQAVLERYPNYAQGKYYQTTLWEMRQYLEKVMRSPEKAAGSLKWDGLLQLRAAVRERLGKNS